MGPKCFLDGIFYMHVPGLPRVPRKQQSSNHREAAGRRETRVATLQSTEIATRPITSSGRLLDLPWVEAD